MARNHGARKLSVKKLHKNPLISVDLDNDFASIRLVKGIEAKSYEKDGFLFSEDANGRVIEIQILNLSLLAKRAKKIA